MINRSNTKIKSWAIHEVSGTQAQALHFSKESTVALDPGLADAVLAHMIDIYKEPMYSGLDTLSPVYSACKRVFESQATLYEESIALSRRFQQGLPTEPIQPLYLMYLWLEDLLIEDELLQGLAVVLLEGRSRYLDVTGEGEELSLWLQQGFLVGKPDAACLILDTDEESGYKVLNAEHIPAGREVSTGAQISSSLAQREMIIPIPATL
ncbi:MAG: hypothetical protein IPN29_13895 [Saprospiraceae bacterium]|nr:hypothetical protein [Saprospiraceae bacterium]